MGVRYTSFKYKTQAEAKRRHRDNETTRCTSRSEKMKQRWQPATNKKERIGGVRCCHVVHSWQRRRSPRHSPRSTPRPVRWQWQIVRQRERREAIFASFSLLTFSFVSIDRQLHVHCKYWSFHSFESTGMILLSPWLMWSHYVFSRSTITPPPPLPLQICHVCRDLKFRNMIKSFKSQLITHFDETCVLIWLSTL